MALNIRRNILPRFYITFNRNYCKSVYEKEEEGKKVRMVYGKPYPEWRKPWSQREGEWTSKLSLFHLKNPSPYIMNALQKLPYIDTQDIRNWWRDMKLVQEIENQRYLPERVAALGSNLAAIHFFTYRQATVKLKDSSDWIAGDGLTLDLPNVFEEGWFVEAVDCSNFIHQCLRFEGVENLQGLNFLRWLSIKNNKHIDVWCLDRIAGQNGNSLEYLDITGCNLCVGGVFAVAKMDALKMLVITDPKDNAHVHAALSILEEEKPNLLIKVQPKEESHSNELDIKNKEQKLL